MVLTDNSGNEIQFPFEIRPIDETTNQHLLHDFLGEPEGYYQVGPLKYLFPSNITRMANELYNYQARPDDIWIVTFPRSGTTLTQELVWILANDHDYETAMSKLLVERSHFFDFSLITHKDTFKNAVDGNDIDPFTNLYKETLTKRLEELTQMKSPRVIKTHLPLSLLPPSVYTNNCKIIYIARNPLDVAVSFYHHSRLFKTSDYIGDFNQFWDYFEKNLIVWSPHLSHVKEAWARKSNKNLLFFFYENMITNLPDCIKKIAKFIGKEINAEQIAKLSNHLCIENFKKNPSVNLEQEFALGFAKAGTHTFIRQGGILNNSEITNEFKQRALKWMNENLKDTDLCFPIK